VIARKSIVLQGMIVKGAPVLNASGGPGGGGSSAPGGQGQPGEKGLMFFQPHH
jgi:hypothetical protein